MAITSISIIKKLLLFFLVFAGLYYAKAFLMPLCIGSILATLFLPFCNWLEAKKLPKGLAVFACLITLLLLASGLIALIGFKVAELLNDVALIKQKAVEVITKIQEYIFNHIGISVAKQSQILQQEQPSVTGIMQMVAASVAYIFSNMTLVFVYFLFLMYYRSHLKIFILKIHIFLRGEA